MFKYSVLLAMVFAVTTPISSANAAQDSDPPVMTSTSYDGETFVAGNWADDNPVDVESWPEDSFFSRMQDDPYPFALMATGLDNDPHFLDQRFNTGSMLGDRFGANQNDTTNKYGHKALRLSNGHVLTVALVPKLGATSDPTAAASWNIGMVRYSDKGVKQKWDNANSAYTDSIRSYYVYPNKDVFNVDGSFTEIHDVKEYKDHIYVLATHRGSATDTGVRIVMFSLTSSAVWWMQDLSWVGTKESGVGLHFYKDGSVDKLTVVGRKIVSSSKTETWMGGYIVGSSGLLTLDTAFGVDGYKDATWCDSCYPQAIAAGTSGGVTYIAGNYLYPGSGTDWDGYVTKHDKRGYRFASFSNDGIKTFWFTTGGGVAPYQEVVRDIVVDPTSNKMFVLASTNSSCSTTSTGVIKMDRTTGATDVSFGSYGELVFGGGGNASGSLPCLVTSSTTPRAMALNGNRLAIAGYSLTKGFFTSGGPSFTIVDKDKGIVKDSRLFKSSGVDIGDEGVGSAFFSVVKSEGDSFYAVGRLKDAVHNQKTLPITARIRADRIFGHGMEN